jgi:hypothetical protein
MRITDIRSCVLSLDASPARGGRPAAGEPETGGAGTACPGGAERGNSDRSLTDRAPALIQRRGSASADPRRAQPFRKWMSG